MESPLSPIIADLVLQDLEEKVLNSIGLNLPMYYRYVDDIVLTTSKNQILNIFNSFHNRLQFTIEYENNQSFLDLKLIITRS